MRKKWKKGDVYDNATFASQVRGESLFVIRNDCESSDDFGTYLGNLDNIPELKTNILKFAKLFDSCFKGSEYGINTKNIDHILSRARADLKRSDSLQILNPTE